MFLFTSFSALAALATSLAINGANAAPLAEKSSLKLRDVTGPTVVGQYIVKLKDGIDAAAHRTSLPFAFSVEDTSSPIISELIGLFNGYVGTFSDSDLAALQASPDVEFVEQDQVYTINDQQNDATWGLQSISSQSQVASFDKSFDTDYTYTYSEPSGDGVDIYIVDTGIYVENQEFEGRATWGFAAGDMQQRDGNGHGTHCAGTAAGKTFGVSKKASLIAVKVLGDNGSGLTSNIISGLNWVITNAATTGKPSVVSMSLGGSPSDALDAVVNQAVTAGITVVVAAGNSNVDASGQSPARVAAAITVAAANITMDKASFSNFGAAVDIWAPGVNIVSAWPYANDTSVANSPSGTHSLSGTSMACPHITGLAAYLISKDTSLKPDTVAAKIASLGRSNVLTGVPDGTVNLLAYNGEGPSTPPPPPADTPSASTTVTLPTAAIGAIVGSALPAPPTVKASKCPSFWADCPWANW
jgi:cerevisin